MTPPQPRQRFPWLVLIVSLLIGIAGGLSYAWFLNPVNLVDVAPSQLQPDDQRAYILLVSEAYMQNQRLDQAQQRLAPLGAHDIAAMVSKQADDALSSGADSREVQA